MGRQKGQKGQKGQRGYMKQEKQHIHVGTSGWTYDDWTGRFYPAEVKGAERLSYYATKFESVEVNATFYRLPYKGMIVGWNNRLPPAFHLVLKGPRSVTHLRKLRNCGDPLAAFFDRVLALNTLKVVLWQLPPSLHKNIELLDHFLTALPDTVRHAVEFRHESWWDDETAEVLGEHRAAFVAISHPTLPDDVIPTTDFLYLRFHGLSKKLYNYDYTRRELRAWATRLKPLSAGRELYGFFNNDFRALATENALVFREMLEKN
jgi:uncharacterized protein YecE (DUF72 family)